MGLKKRQLNTFSLDYYLPFVLMMLCGRLTESWGIFYSHMIKVDVLFFTLVFGQQPHRQMVAFLTTCILAARAPYMELSSLVNALCNHQQKLRQH